MIINWQVLSHSEGWGIVGILGLIFVSLMTLILDLVLQLLIKNKFIHNAIGLLVAFFVIVKLFMPHLD